MGLLNFGIMSLISCNFQRSGDHQLITWDLMWNVTAPSYYRNSSSLSLLLYSFNNIKSNMQLQSNDPVILQALKVLTFIPVISFPHLPHRVGINHPFALINHSLLFPTHSHQLSLDSTTHLYTGVILQRPISLHSLKEMRAYSGNQYGHRKNVQTAHKQQ